MSRSLYNLNQDYEELLNKLYDDSMDEQAIFDTIESLEWEIEDKAKGYAYIIAEMQKDIAGYKAEIERMSKNKAALENNIERMKNNLMQSLKATGMTKIKTPLFKFSIAKKGGQQTLKLKCEVQELPSIFRIEETSVKADNKAIREFIANNNGECSFAELLPRGEYLKIK